MQTSDLTTYSFTRRFVRGHLVGLTHDDTISMPTFRAFRAWVEAINDAAHSEWGTVEYEIIWAEGDEIAAQTPVEVY